MKSYAGSHRGKNNDRQCKLCGDECESVVHVLWECPVYDSIRSTFIVELENLLGGGGGGGCGRFEEFSALDRTPLLWGVRIGKYIRTLLIHTLFIKNIASRSLFLYMTYYIYIIMPHTVACME